MFGTFAQALTDRTVKAKKTGGLWKKKHFSSRLLRAVKLVSIQLSTVMLINELANGLYCKNDTVLG